MRVVVLGLAIACAVVAAQAAEARDALIRPGVGIAKVRLGMTEAQVRASFGKPMAVVREQRGFGRRYVELQYGFGSYTVSLLGRPGRERVVSVSTVLRKERTPEGAGYGMLERDLVRTYRGRLRCEDHEYVDSGRGILVGRSVRRCFLGSDALTGFVVRGPSSTRPEHEEKWNREARVSEVFVWAPGYRLPRPPF